MGHARTWQVYTPGQVIGHCEVLAVAAIEGRYRHQVTYRIRLTCCGTECVRSHEWIADTHDKGVQRCHACRIAHDRVVRAQRQAARVPQVIRACGSVWSSLGRMGFRNCIEGAE